MEANRESADNWPTQQLWPAPGPGGGGHVPNPPGPGGPGPGSGGHGPRRPRHLTRWVVGITAAAVLAGGGAVALASAGPPAAPGGQAATLNTVLSSADSPSVADVAAASPSSATPATAPATAPAKGARRAAACARAIKRLRAAHHPVAAHRVRALCRRGLGRLRLLVRGIHGQFTFQTKKGTRTLAFERGTIQSVSGGAVTVKAADGTTWTWHVVSNTVVRQDGKKVASSTLADGQRVFVGGPVGGGADNARLVVIRPAAPAGAGSSSPAPAS
jgi:hypothetical protein